MGATCADPCWLSLCTILSLHAHQAPCVQASHLLKYDSTLGPFNGTVSVVDDKTLSVDGKHIAVRTTCLLLQTGCICDAHGFY